VYREGVPGPLGPILPVQLRALDAPVGPPLLSSTFSTVTPSLNVTLVLFEGVIWVSFPSCPCMEAAGSFTSGRASSNVCKAGKGKGRPRKSPFLY